MSDEAFILEKREEKLEMARRRKERAFIGKQKRARKKEIKADYIERRESVILNNEPWPEEWPAINEYTLRKLGFIDEANALKRNRRAEWRIENPIKRKTTYKNNELYRLKQYLRQKCRDYIIKGHGKKFGEAKELLGCSHEEARGHIEKLFTEGMSWDNYGVWGWHIDHIKPCAVFDLTNKEQQKECYNIKNLQPLWREDNMTKRDKWEEK